MNPRTCTRTCPRCRGRRSQRASIAALLFVVVALSGCRTTDLAFRASDGRLLSDMAPAPYSVAIAPVEDLIEPGDAGSLRLTHDATALQRELVRGLVDQRAASHVFAVGSDSLAEARVGSADLLLRPRLVDCSFERRGRSSRSVIAFALWLGTWIGGTFVEDTTYDARMQIEWEVVNPYDGLVVDDFRSESERVDLTFWERNDPASLGTIQSALLPPFWTSDDLSVTSQSLTQRSTERMAALATHYLKQTLPESERELMGEFRLESPRNGTHCGPRVRVRARVTAREPIRDVALFVNDALDAAPGLSTPPADAQRRGNLFVVPIDTEIDLERGKNLVHVEFSVGGYTSCRSIELLSQIPEVE